MRSYLGLLIGGMIIATGGCKPADATGGAGGGKTTGAGTPTATSTGAGTGTGTGAGTGGGSAADACMGIPVQGQCTTTSKVQSCFVSEEAKTPPKIIEVTCKADEACTVVKGTAACTKTGACFDGDSSCKDAMTVQTCMAGAWVDGASCGAGTTCTSKPGKGATCGLPQDSGGSGITLQGHVDYEFHKRLADLSDFDTAISTDGAFDMYVTVYDGTTLIGATLTKLGTNPGEKAGDWKVDLSQDPTDKTFVYFWPMLFDDAGNPRMALAKAQSPMVSTQASDTYWSFGFGAVCATPGSCKTTDMGTQLITEAMGSGAVHIYQWIDYGIFRLKGLIPAVTPLTTAVFWAPGNEFDCGSCFAPPQMGGADVAYDKANMLNDHYDSSLNIAGTDMKPAHWATTTINHELGHWMMQSYSKSPGEGGQHFVDQASSPGLAYSEGWATFAGQTNLSSGPADPDPIAFRKANGTTFWVDISKATWSGGALALPDPNGAIDQPVNENIVTVMMWSLWATAKAQAPQMLGDAPMFAALGSNRLVSGINRGYKTLDMVDYLDAMKCDKLATAAQITAVAMPVTYPYDNMEICQ